MGSLPPRVLLHLGRDRRRAVDPEDVYFLEAVGETTLVRWVRRRSAQRGWEVKLEPPVNRVLPVGGTYLARLWAAFGDK